MANDIIPQDLLIYRTIITDALTKITNEMYAKNIKISYKYSFTKVPTERKPSVFLDLNKPIYLFTFYCVDKSRNPIGETMELYHMFYPKSFDETIYKIERRAIQEWFTNASKSLYNNLRESYLEEIKAKQAIIDKRAAQGVTAETIADEITRQDAEFTKKREAEILAMMPTNIIK